MQEGNTMHYKYTDIKAIVAEILENKKDEGGVKNIYFVGCGGSLGALYPAKTFMERESLTLKSGWVSSNEFVHSTPRDFGKNSIICKVFIFSIFIKISYYFITSNSFTIFTIS